MADIDQQSCVFSDNSTSIIAELSSWGLLVGANHFFLLFPFCFPWSSGYGGAVITLNCDLTEQSSDNYSPILSLQIQNEF